MKPRLALSLVGLMAVLIALAVPPPVRAQPALISAFPGPGSVLPASPSEIALTFDRILTAGRVMVEITDEQGVRIQNGPEMIDPANRFVVRWSLPTLVEGRYTVHYAASSVGSSTFTTGSYQFTVDLPPSRLALLTPVDGQAFPTGAVPLELRTEFFDFGQYDNRIRIYVDGTLYTEIRALGFTITGLEPGVHQIRTVLAQFEDTEIPETSIIVHIAIAQPTPEAAHTPADPDDSQVGPLQLVITALATLGLLGIGIWLGRITRAPS